MSASSAFLNGTAVFSETDSFPVPSQETSPFAALPMNTVAGVKRKLSDDDNEAADSRPLTRPKMDAAQSQDQQSPRVVEPGPDHSTGIVYDPRMRYHFQRRYKSDRRRKASGTPIDLGLHPEDPRRIAKIMHALKVEDLVCTPEDSALAPKYPRRINARDVTEQEVLAVHTAEHLALVAGLQGSSEDELDKFESLAYDSLYACRNTAIAARLAAGGTVDICKAVMKGDLKNGFAVVRPPGHHAEPDAPRGFCWYNNVSIAARALLDDPELNCSRVLVVDWDIHHGNGIQAAHYGDSDVLYISLHRNDKGFYPRGVHWGDDQGRDNETYGDRFQTGRGAGAGYNVNIPWSGGGRGDGDYIYAFDQVVLPIAREYNPDIILVASGFDAAAGDALGQCFVSDGGYAYMTHQLMGITSKVVVVLEGGYNMMSIALSAVGVVKALLGRPLPKLPNSLPSPEGVLDVDRVVEHLRDNTLWKTLTPRRTTLGSQALPPDVQEVIRQWQISQMWDRHNLYPLFIPQEPLLPIYKNSVLATPGLCSREAPLLVILHEAAASPNDNPDFIEGLDNLQDPITGEDHLRLRRVNEVNDDNIVAALERSDARIIESTGSYVDNAIRMGYDIIDIHLPDHTTTENAVIDSFTDESGDLSKRVATETLNLLTYVFDHYVKTSHATAVFVMGTEVGHTAIARYIMANEIYAMEHITGTFHFVLQTTPQMVRSHTSDYLNRWYQDHSSVFIHRRHSFWEKVQGKTRLRYGNTKQSGTVSDRPRISDMLHEHRNEISSILQKYATTTTNDQIEDDSGNEDEDEEYNEDDEGEEEEKGDGESMDA